MAAKKKAAKKGGRNGSNGANGDGGDFHEDPPRSTTTDGEGNNSDARLKALDEALEEHCELQEEEDRLLEKHIQPIRDKKNRVKSRLKSDYEIPTAAFNARASLRMIERQGEDEVVLATNEMFRATPVGANMDLIAIADRVAAKKAEKEAVAAEKAAAKAKVQTNAEATL